MIIADRSARLWDVETGQCLLRYLGHNGSGGVNILDGFCYILSLYLKSILSVGSGEVATGLIG